ncbi:BTAD domain-containing putative transcriptional regulator [Plantactinospora sp. KLBMP9567]|uniref:AfsR/SARP family transcriptional regulator n=1 Tax=Plantactinospora sp. KLBMP9567 TaxID=3085900 RepID=UPI002982993B|nr:BTAD domain-containing putative transcriptional regulator [Plantactinospora sp. KLBMP9567]MDW5327038.1 BTAD domain-containing putative transcriptional regulator [Plantactinospora sp. KLBMP9567]
MLFHVLGPIEVHGGTAVRRIGGSKPGALLATLLTKPNAWMTTDELVATIWPEQAAPASAEANLKTYVWTLRRGLPEHDGGPRIESRPGAYRIRVGRGERDVDRVGELAEQARCASAGGDAGTAATLLDQALRMWRGRPFADLEGNAATGLLAHLEDLRLGLAERLAEAQLAVGRGQDAVATLRAVTADAPLREEAWALLVRVLHETGRRAEALAEYRRARQLLCTELGVEPGAALAEAHRLALGAARIGPVRRELPRDVPLAGRRAELAVVGEAARDSPAPVVLVHGMAGVGKTAFVVHAGHRLAPDYPDGQFFVRVAGNADGGTPGAAAALHRLLRGVGVPVSEIPPDLDERSALWRSELARRRVLLVLDDVPDPDQLTPLLPATPGCLTLATTTNRGWHPDGATRVGLAPLPTEAAAALFRSALGARHEEADQRSVLAVAQLCGGLPAALRDAAARLLCRPHWTTRRLVDELDEDPCRVLSDAVRRSIVDARRPPAGRELALWYALGDLPGEFGTAAAARALGVTPGAARPVLEALVDRGLLDVAAAERYRSHVLVRHMARCTAPVGGPVREHHRGRRVA